LSVVAITFASARSALLRQDPAGPGAYLLVGGRLMPLVREGARREGRPGSWLVLLAALGGVLIFLGLPLLRVSSPYLGNWAVETYCLVGPDSNPWPWTSEPTQGFSSFSRMLDTSTSLDCYALRAGPLVWELHGQRGWADLLR
jgi:hypothetical protein